MARGAVHRVRAWRAAALALLLGGCTRDINPVRPDAVSPRATRAFDRDEHDSRSDRAESGGESFESFRAGAIQGQGDWLSLGGTLGTPCAAYDHAISDNAAWPAPRSFGARSLRISNAVTSGCYSDQTFSHRARDPAGQAGAVTKSADGLVDYALPGGTLRNHFDARWTFISTVPDAQQPGLEVVVSAARGDDLRMSWVQMADLADGIAIVFADRMDPANPGAINRTVVARGLDRRRAHVIRLAMDFADGPLNDVVRLYVDNARVHTGGSWEAYYALDANGRQNFAGASPAVNRLMFRTGSDTHRGVPGDPAPATRGRGFAFDDVAVDSWSSPRTAPDCKREGWRALRSADGVAYRNQGDCVSSVRR